MRVSIDGAGRLVLPKPIRESAGLYAGAELDVSLLDGDVIELPPAPRRILVEQRGHLFDATPLYPEPAAEVAQATLDTLRRERLRDQGPQESQS